MSYPSDITREQFNKILPLLEKTKKTTKPRTLDYMKYLMLCFMWSLQVVSVEHYQKIIQNGKVFIIIPFLINYTTIP